MTASNGRTFVGQYHFCIDCEHIVTRMVPGFNGLQVRELACPARFNPMEAKWILRDGPNPHECPRNDSFMQLQQQSGDRRLR
jgi:hypothetical protein